MILFDIKSGVDEENIIKKVLVEITDDGKVLRKVTLDIDKVYKVSPYNKRKMKHKDKNGVVISFKRDEDNDTVKAHLQFSGDNNFGWVDVQDLEEIKK